MTSPEGLHLSGARKALADGNPAEALRILRHGARALRGEDVIVGKLLKARALRLLGKPRGALKLCVSALRVARSSAQPNPIRAAAALNELGMVLTALGRYRWALGCYEKAEDAYSDLGDTEGAAFAGNNRGTILYLLGDYDSALKLQVEALGRLQNLGAERSQVARGLRNVGAALHKLGRFSEAEAKYRDALRMLGPERSTTRHLRGGLLLNRGAARERLRRKRLAIADYRAALDIGRKLARNGDSSLSAEAAYHLASLIGNVSPGSAQAELARRAVLDALRCQRVDLVWRCLGALARQVADPAYRVFFGKLAAALLWREARQASGQAMPAYLGARAHAFSELVGDLIDMGRLSEAFSIGAAADRFGVIDAMPVRRAKSEPIALAPIERIASARWLKLSTRIAKGGTHLQNTALLTWLRRPFERQRAAAGAKYLSMGQPEAASARLIVSVGEDRSRISLVRRGAAPVVFSVDKSIDQISREVFAFAHACRVNGEIETCRRLGERLCKTLIAPALAELSPDIVNLQILADGPLRALPWSALRDGGAYLVERFTIEVLCGGRSTRSTPPFGRAIHCFAAGLPAPGFSALPEAAREARHIAEVYGDRAAPPLIDSDFTASDLITTLKRGARTVHIASHFRLDAADLRRSALRLGDGDALSAADLARVPWGPIDEVVISACDSGLPAGNVGSADAKSLPDLLAGLGVRHSVAALWPVADASTADLMIVYHSWRRSGASPAAALALAQRSALSRNLSLGSTFRGIGAVVSDATTNHPRHWAGFAAYRTVAPHRKVAG